MYSIKTELNEKEIISCIKKSLKCDLQSSGWVSQGMEYLIKKENVEGGHLVIKKINNEFHEIYFLDISQKDASLIEQEINSKKKGE